MDGIINSASGLSPIQTLGTIFNTLRYYNKDNDMPWYFSIPIEIASDSVTGFIPSPLRQAAQAMDTTYRDQYLSKNLGAQIQAKVANSIPGLRNQLTPKITPLGTDKKLQSPVLNALNATVNPGSISVYTSTPVIDEALRVYEATGKATVLPESNAPYSMKLGNEKYTLTPDERTQYQRTRGQEYDRFTDELLHTDWYTSADAEFQADILAWVQNFTNYIAVEEFSDGRDLGYANDKYDKYFQRWLAGESPAEIIKAANSKTVTVAEENVAAEATIAAAKIPEASKQEAETMSAEAKRLYAGFLKGGVSDSTARDLATKLEGSTATGHEQWREVYNAAGKEGEKAVTSVMDDEMKRNWQFAKNVGVSMDDYIKVREGFQDLNGNGKKTQDEWNATLDSFTFSTNADKDKQIKGTLWQILTGSSSTKNNPYDKAAGQAVIDAKENGGSSGRGKTYSMGGLRLPTPERREPISSGLRLQSTPAAKPSSGGLKLR